MAKKLNAAAGLVSNPARQKMTELLLKMISEGSPIPTLQNSNKTNTDLAKYILLNSGAGIQPPVARSSGAASKHSGGGMGIIGHLLDIVSRPMYAVDEGLRESSDAAAKHEGMAGQLGNFFKGLPQGFLGHKHTTMSDLLQQGADIEKAGKQGDTANYEQVHANMNPFVKYGAGFLGDVFTDPLSAIGPGEVKAAARLVGIGKKAGETGNVLSKAERLQSPLHDTILPATTEPTVKLPDALDAVKFNPKAVQSKSLTQAQRVKINKALQEGLLNSKAAPKVPQAASIELANPVTKAQKLGPISGLLDKLEQNKLLTSLSSEAARRPPVGQAKDAIELQRKLTNAEIKNSHQIIDGVNEGNLSDIAKVMPKAKPEPNLAEIHPNAEADVEYIAQATADQARKGYLTANGERKLAKNNLYDPNSLNAYQQAKLFRDIRNRADAYIKELKNVRAPHAIKKMQPLRFAYTYRMLHAAEQSLQNMGLRPANGYWLSDVISQLGPHPDVLYKDPVELSKALNIRDTTKIQDPQIRQAVENVRARSAMEDAPKINNGVASMFHMGESIFDENFISEAQKKYLIKETQKRAQRVMLGTDASSQGVEAGTKLAKTVLDSLYSPALRALDSKSVVLRQVLARGKYGKEGTSVNQALTRGLTSTLPGTPKELAKVVGPDNGAIPWFMSRFATWYGKRDLQPELLNTLASAKASAFARAKVTQAILKGSTPEQRLEAFRVAQGMADASDKTTGDVAQYLAREFENLFSSTDIDKIAGANTVVTRSGILMNELNRHLRHFRAGVEFTNGKTKDILGAGRDYSKGADWLKSWESWHVTEDPATFMFKVQSAVEQAAREKALFDELGERWGSVLPKGEYRVKIQHPYLDGYHFSHDIAPQVQNVIRSLNTVYDPGSPLMRQLDKVISAWKTGVTIYAPSHHIRNAIGDIFLAWQDGVNGVAPFNIARKVLLTQRAKYAGAIEDPDMLTPLVQIGAINKAFAKVPHPQDVLFRSKGGLPFSAEQVYIAAFNKGMLQHAHAIEDIFGEPLMAKFKPLGGKGQQIAHTASELREHWIRLAHFIDILKKSPGKDLNKVIDDAAARVRKWHPDGIDQTDFERRVMRRIMPFYSWTRKSIPLIIEGAAMNPGKIAVYPKMQYALQGSQGIESDSPADPFPTDQLFPNWIQEKGIGPIASVGMGGPAGFLANNLVRQGPAGEKDYGILNPSNPLLDTASQFSEPGKGLGQLVTPAARIPFELMSGHRMLTNEPIQGQLGEYLTEQIPGASTAQRLSNVGPTGLTVRGKKEGTGNAEAIINYLTAAGLLGTGPYIKSAQFEEKARAKKRASNS